MTQPAPEPIRGDTVDTYMDQPDAGVAYARPEFQYGLLNQILLPLVEGAVAATNDDQEQLKLIYRVLIKYGQKCIRDQKGWLTKVINELLMDARTRIGQDGVALSTVEQMFTNVKLESEGQTQDEDAGKRPPQSGPQVMVPTVPGGVAPPSTQVPPLPGLQQPVIEPPKGGGMAPQQGEIKILKPDEGKVIEQPFRPVPPPPVIINSPTISGGNQQTVVTVNVPPCPAPGVGEVTGDKPDTAGVGDDEEDVADGEENVPRPRGGEIEVKGWLDEVLETAKATFPFLPNVEEWKPTHPAFCAVVEGWAKVVGVLGGHIVGMMAKYGNSAVELLMKDATVWWGYQAQVGPRLFRFQMWRREDLQAAVAVILRVVSSQNGNSDPRVVGAWAMLALMDVIETKGYAFSPTDLSDNLNLSIGWTMPQIRQILEYIANYLAPVTIPTADATTALLLADRITLEQAQCLWRLAGVEPGAAYDQFIARRQRPDPFTITRELFRFHRDIQEVHAEFRQQGWIDTKDVDRYIRANEFIPPPTDAISWTVREVFSTVETGNDQVLKEYADQVGLSEVLRLSGVVPLTFRPEKPERLTELLTKHQKAVPWITPAGDGLIRMDVPMMYWAAHYDHISPMQAYEMLHRLRPNRLKRYPLKDAKGNIAFPEKFDIDDVRNLLKLKDYHPIWRDRLAAISFRPLGRIDVKRIYQTGGFGEQKGSAGFRRNPDGSITPTGEAEIEIVEQYKDNGYADIDAIRLGMFAAGEYDKTDATGRRKKAITLACKAFKAGVIDRDQYFRDLEKVGVSREDAAVLVDNCEAELDYEQAVEGIRAVKKMFLRGIIDIPMARGFLANVGVVADRADRYLSLWAIDLKGREKAIPASEMCQWYQDGLISLAEMELRLLRIGYSPVDAARVIRHCQIGQAAKGAKAAEARAKAAAKEAKARFAHRSEKFMIAAFKAKQINALGVFNTLLSQGWPAGDAQTWVRVNLKVNVDGTEFKADAEAGPEEGEESPA